MVALYISIIMLMRVLQSLFSKRASSTVPDGVKPYITYISVMEFMAAGFALITLMINREFAFPAPREIIIAACSGCFLAFNSLCGIKALKGGTMALSSVFSTSGMLIPCILGAAFFDEPMSPIQVLCIAALLASTVLLISSSKKIFNGFSPKMLFWLIGSMLSNGMVMFAQKLFGMTCENGNVSAFSMLTFLIPATALAVAIPFVGKADKTRANADQFPRVLVLYAAVLAFAVFIVQQFVTLLTPMLSSAVLFAFVNGGATIITTIVGATVYKEKITVKSALGVLIGIGALILIKVF